MRWKLLLGTLLSVFFLWLAFRQARLDEILHALASARYWLVLPVVVLTMVAYAVRAWRWRFLLEGVRTISFGPLFASIMIGFMGNNLLPARLGELLRAHSLGRSTGVSRATALASIVLERIFDIFVLLVLFAAILLLRGLPQDVRSWGLTLLVLAAPVLIALILFEAYPGPVLRLVGALLPKRMRERVFSVAMKFRHGLGVLRSPRQLIFALVLSFVMWGCIYCMVTLSLLAFDLQLPPEAGAVVMVVIAIGTMLPSAPGYVGTLQYAGTLALIPYGVDRSVALSFTLLYHATQWFPVNVAGVICLLRENISLRQLSSAPEGEA